MSKTDIKGFYELSPKAVKATMAGVIAAMLLAALDQTIVGTAMPRIISELHGFEHYSGVLTSYLVASTAIVPIVGKLSDLYGRKFFLVTGVLFFVIASVLCGASRSMTELIVFRGLQGLGAGIVQAMAFTTIADLFPPAKRGRISGLMGAVFGLASVVGPSVGGFLTDGPGWRYVFYVNLPVGVMALALLYFFFPHIRIEKEKKVPIDYAGAATLVLWVVPILLALSWGGRDYLWNSSMILSLIGFGLVMLTTFIFVETKAEEPVIPFKLFESRIVWTSMVATTVVSMGLFGVTLFIPLFIQAVLGSTATRSGAVMMPMTLALILTSILTGQLITRTGKYKMFALFGVAMTCFGIFLLSLMDMQTSYASLMRNIIIIGLGLGATMPVYTLAVQNAVALHFVGIGTSTLQFMRSVGGALGASIFGSILANQFVNAFHANLPDSVSSVVSAEQLKPFENPQALLQPGGSPATENFLNSFGEKSNEIKNSIMLATKTALAQSLHDVFLFGALILLVAIFATLLLKDIPLRKTNRPDVLPHVD